ncbi:hypothetical protein N0V85_003472 [Neurospora sp. IMI 360204]|nr:hypothetical protein N0V85_003472 [Neurospora sp. IMI 360204]
MAEWSLDKYSNKGKARQAGPAAAVATPAVFDLTGSTIQQSVEHAPRNGDERGSSSANDGNRNNELPPTLPPRPTSPTLATTHILPAPQKTEDRHSEPALFPAHAHSIVTTASTPSVDAGVEQIHGESHSSSSPSAQVDGVVSRALEISDGFTAAGEVSGVTEAQDTPSTPAGETDPAPNRSKTDIENREPIKLARDFKRLTKESDRIRKQAGQEIQDIKKKRRKEIKNVKLRSKRELKRLKKKMKRLENEVKSLARPDAESVVG